MGSDKAGEHDADLDALQDLLGPRAGHRTRTPGLKGRAQIDARARHTAPATEPGRVATPPDIAASAAPDRPYAPAAAGGASPAGNPPDDAEPEPGGPSPTAPSDPARDPGASARADAGGAPTPAVGPPDATGERTDRPPRAVSLGRDRVIEGERVPSDAIVALSPLDPGIGLADRLRRDHLVTVPDRLAPRIGALAAAAVLLLLWVLALRASALGRPWPDMGLPAAGMMLVLALASVAAFFGMRAAWPKRELRLPLAPTQAEQLERVEEQARLMRLAMLVGVLGVAAGLLVMALTFAFVPQQQWAGVAGFGALVAATGLVLAIVGLARWLPVRLLYVQTMVLDRLETLGLGRQLAMDPRTAEVLVSLDQLLGELPESAVRQFLSKPEAEWYLELIADVKEGRRGR